MIFVVASAATCFGVLITCIMATASRSSREEERRAIENSAVVQLTRLPAPWRPEK